MHCARQDMGAIADFAKSIAGAAAGSGGGKTSSTPSMPGSAGGGGGGAGPISVSPNIQTQVSPQISPVFQQTGSGSQTASTSMIAPGGQSAKGGDATDAMPEADIPSGSSYYPRQTRSNDPYSRGQPYSDPFMPGFDISRYTLPGSTAGQMTKQSQSSDWLKYALGGVALVSLAVIGSQLMGSRNKPRPMATRRR